MDKEIPVDRLLARMSLNGKPLEKKFSKETPPMIRLRIVYESHTIPAYENWFELIQC
jgi:hypothetical protein